MSLVQAEVTVNLKGLKKFQKIVESDLKNQTRGPVRSAMRQWAFRYRAFLRERFNRLSRGGGSWPPLKYRVGSILRDTNTLFTALSPTFSALPGQLQQDKSFAILVGYGTRARHPSGNVTIEDLAFFHQTGAGSLPVRQIIVPPSSAVTKQMRDDMNRALKKLAKLTDTV